MAEGAEGVAPVLPKSITSLTSFDGDTTTRTTFYKEASVEEDKTSAAGELCRPIGVDECVQ